MRSMRRRVRENDVTHWAAAFMEALTQVSRPSITAS
jgi:trehalose-6-phosphate synthase